MVATAIARQLRPNRYRRLLLQSHASSLQFSSSSSNSNDNHQNETSESSSSSPLSSYVKDVKASLKQTGPSPLPPRRPSFFDSNLSAGDVPTRKVDSLEEIRKNLSEFRRRSSDQPPPSSSPTISFQELYKKNVMPQADRGPSSEDASNSLKTIRMSLRNQLSRPSLSQQPEVPVKRSSFNDLRQSLKLRPESLNEKVPESIGKDKKDVVSDDMKTEFVRMYSFGELGEKLKKLRPEVKGTKTKGFSLGELNDRLRKLRAIEEKENENRNGLRIWELRESLYSLQISQDEKKTKTNAAQRLNVLGQIGGTPSFMLSPPKEALVEKYFHPDHMPSSEKQKIELKKVRDKFKMSESDCGSARVQVAQLTTKIKHLATVLHKKDKHSRKGLQAMVQRRKKLLKYLRRTNWDSYCFCLAELGLRDSADYKV